MAKVKVPRTPKSSYNPERRPSALLLDQVKHLEWAALPASQRKPEQLKIHKQVKTEWQAAERIAQLTHLIAAAKDAMPIREVALGALPPVVLPPLPPRMPRGGVRRAASKKRKASTRKRKPARAAKPSSPKAKKAVKRAAPAAAPRRASNARKRTVRKATPTRRTARSSARSRGKRR
jgi:hypothetical protein